ncbi:HET-domain-containing protein [Apiospora saccharicola]|uniref:HET-domain-containing protein n=1 Tax=Apiospora saccharicola TaxID=335842 RepID=A0ABR1W0F1_9PEZI
MAIWGDDGVSASAPGLFSTTPPLSSDSAVEARYLYSTWLDTCRNQHEKCKTKLSGTLVDEELGPELPTRILDLGDPTARNLALLESKGRRGEYCALSYCWGPPDSQTFLTTTETLHDRLRGIDFDALPKTFQDAVQITRSLGMRYLWVDGLCIIQGDKDDWESEAGRMGAVYENASLVIAASGSASAQEGCFATGQREMSSVDLPYYSDNGQFGGLVHVCQQIFRWEDASPTDGPLQQRGWALQEAYFARRALHFMPGGPTWRCREEQLNERNNRVRLFFDTAWEGIIENYSKRQLTYKSDRLVAIQAYATELQKKNADIYDLGVFLSRLPSQLLWINRFRTNSDGLAESRVDLPSWTWASIGGEKYLLAYQLSFSVPHLAPVITSDRFHIDDTGSLLVQGRTTMCLNSDDRVSETYKGLTVLPAPLAPLQNLFESLRSYLGTDALYLTEPAESPHSRLQGVAYFDDEPYDTVYVLPLMTGGVWKGPSIKSMGRHLVNHISKLLVYMLKQFINIVE